MQTQLPIFPSQTKLINASLGVRRQDDFVYYLHNGSPVFCHHIDNQNNYRYILANLVTSGLCRCSELADALGVNRRNVERYAQSLRENGSDWFFGRPIQRGRGYEFYYIDGHVQVYHGYKANLGKKHVARQKLCLPGMQEFLVNNMQGLPYFYVTGPVNEKLRQMIEFEILPALIAQVATDKTKHLPGDTDRPRFTIIFDREAYSPSFFNRLPPRDNAAVQQICQKLNETQTAYPGTDLVLQYDLAT